MANLSFYKRKGTSGLTEGSVIFDTEDKTIKVIEGGGTVVPYKGIIESSVLESNNAISAKAVMDYAVQGNRLNNKIVVTNYYSYGNFSDSSTGMSIKDFLQEYCKQIVKDYPNNQKTSFLSKGAPASEVFILYFVYDTSKISDTGFIEHSYGTCYAYDGISYIFGTKAGVFYYYSLVNADGKVHSLYSLGIRDNANNFGLTTTSDGYIIPYNDTTLGSKNTAFNKAYINTIIGTASAANRLSTNVFESGDDLNLDKFREEGIWVTTQTNIMTSLLNAPSKRTNGECRLEVKLCGSSSYGVQIFYTRGKGLLMKNFIRTFAGSTFTEWTQMTTEDNIKDQLSWSGWN